MTILDQVRHIPDGIKHITDWLGDGGQTESKEVAQDRADICNHGYNGVRCPNNVKSWQVTTAIALAIKAHLGIKNAMKLRVSGEKQLGACSSCGCVLRLLIWETQDRVRLQSEGEELPDYCWKTKSQ